jgi:hypothetical protein
MEVQVATINIGNIAKERTTDNNLRSGLDELSDTWSNFPGLGIDASVEVRLDKDGPMALCRECSKDCKVPCSRGVTQFFCTDFDGPMHVSIG